MALTTQSGFRYLSYLPTLWMGNLRGTEGVHFYKADTIICEPLDKNPVYAQVDGEPLARLPVEFKIVPAPSSSSSPSLPRNCRVELVPPAPSISGTGSGDLCLFCFLCSGAACCALFGNWAEFRNFFFAV